MQRRGNFTVISPFLFLSFFLSFFHSGESSWSSCFLLECLFPIVLLLPLLDANVCVRHTRAHTYGRHNPSHSFQKIIDRQYYWHHACPPSPPPPFCVPSKKRHTYLLSIPSLLLVLFQQNFFPTSILRSHILTPSLSFRLCLPFLLSLCLSSHKLFSSFLSVSSFL